MSAGTLKVDSWLRWSLRNGGSALAYMLFGQLGLALALPPGYVSAIWPAAGIAVACCAVYGPRQVWLGVLIGSLATNIGIGGHFNFVALGIAVGSTLQSVLAASWLRWRNPSLALDNQRRVLEFSLVAITGCTVAAVCGNLTLYLAGTISASQLMQSLITWWLGDAFGVQIFAPLTWLVLGHDASWRARRLLVGLPLVGAFLLCGVIYYMVREGEERQLKLTLAARGEPMIQELSGLDRVHGIALRQLAANYRHQDRFPGIEFAEVAEEIGKSLPAIEALAWAPLWDRLDPGAPPGSAAYRAPVTQLWVRPGRSSLRAIDLLADPEIAPSVHAALASGAMSMTPPIKPPGAEVTQVFLIVPSESYPGIGVFVAVLNVDAIGNWLAKIEGAQAELVELRPEGPVSRWRNAGALPHFEGQNWLDRRGVYIQQDFKLADRRWRVVLYQPHSALAAENGKGGLLVLFMSLLASSIFSSLLLLISSDRERIAAEVMAKTMALREEMSQREAAQAALMESRTLLESVVENSAASIMVKDTEGIYCLVNSQWERVTGIPRARALGRDDLELFPGRDGQAFIEADRAVLESGETVSFEERLESQAGTRWFWSVKFPLRNEVGKITGMCGMITEVTDRKRAEQRLQESEMILRSAIETIGEAFVVYDQADRLVTFNEEYRSFYAISAPVIQPGRSFEEILRYGLAHGQYQQAVGREEAWIAERLAAHRSGKVDLLQKLEDGRWLRIRERKTPAGYIVGFRVDVTELMLAKEAAESASVAKSQFLATMSHEIRTPLNGILGMAQLLQMDDIGEAERIEFARTIANSGQALLGLLNDILDLSKIEAGRLELKPAEFSPEVLLRDVAALFRAQAEAKGLRLDVAWQGGTAVFVADALRLRQMLVNLVSNAIKFSERGTITIAGRALADDQGGCLEFSVSDEGIGISEAQQARLFQPFVQVDASITRRVGGTGLGLSIVRRLAEQMHGAAGVESREGEGARFWFRIRAERVGEGS